MATLTPRQQTVRTRVEALIGLAAPVLDLVLAAGERIARMTEPEDTDYQPPRRIDPAAPPPRSPGGARPTV
jgi:hypothetical protein